MTTKRKGFKLYLVSGNTDEVLESHPLSGLAKALRTARTEGCQVVIARSLSEAEDIAAGVKAGPMFWPGKVHHGHRRSSRRNSRRSSRRRTSRR
jgi:hypothetical protein